MKPDKQFPVKRIGNEKNPKLVILLYNPGGNPNYYKMFPWYTMHLDKGRYKESGMAFSDVRQYCEWWNDILVATEEAGIKNSEILALEYYKYPTPTSDEIPKKEKWDSNAIMALEENKKILRKFMDKKDVLIFGWFWKMWVEEVPGLNSCDNFKKSEQPRGRHPKIKELKEWLVKRRGE